MDSTSVKELRKLLGSDLGPTVSQVVVQVVAGPDGVLHRREHQLCYKLNPSPRPGGTAPALPPGAVTLEDLVASEVCSSCESALVGWSTPLHRDQLVTDALYVHRARAQVKGMVKVTGRTSATAVQNRLARIPGVLSGLERLLAREQPTLLAQAAEELVKELERAQGSLQQVSRGDESREKLERQVKALMLPRRFAGQDVNLDRTPLLIGVSPAPTRYSAGNQVRAVVDAYSVRQDSVAVLVAPAFMYAFLLQQLFPKATSETLVVSTPAPEDEEVHAVAAALWDPEGEGALACIEATLTAARSI